MAKGKKGGKKSKSSKSKKGGAAAPSKGKNVKATGGLAPAEKEEKLVWLESKTEKVWELAKVHAVSGTVAIVIDSSNKRTMISTSELVEANKTVEADMTALHHIHEAGILHNLNERCISDNPYTLMGPVLVAVNPLRRIPDPDEVLGKAQAASKSHPYGIAEIAYQQLSFAHGQKKLNPESDAPINQSVVVGGESGAGKTESSKMVLKHLVARAGGKSDLDKRLLGSNPILEAFGNATTLRNHNSSRFGKFMKLHLKVGKSTKLSGASVATYLLERSRVTAHGHGERNYHIFYQLVTGAPSKLRKKLGLGSISDFTYLTPSSGEENIVHESRQKMDDVKDFEQMHAALQAVDMSSEAIEETFKLVAGILHLGNIKFVEDEKKPDADASAVDDANGALKKTAELFGLDPSTLSSLFCERKVRSVNEVITAYRDVDAAGSSRDAVAKGFYSKIFDYVLAQINKSLAGKGSDISSLPFIGVLDIFGFESFQHNDFEQLLINFTNEALQATFNKQVFESEADLYRREGLKLAADEAVAEPERNTETMTLLVGKPKSIGVLTMIDQEGRNPNPTDEKLLNNMHRAFNSNACYVNPHPRDKASKFIIKHYAGLVQYTVGQFIYKNSDRLPSEVVEVFANSKLALVKSMWEDDAAAAAQESKPGKKAARNDSIVKKFNGQIMDLVSTLDSTRCSFIRCVKPNHLMVRDSSPDWFNRSYVTSQLKCLSIPATAAVLQTGLPTRIMYSALTESYKKVLPKEALNAYELLGGGDERAFVSALFWAFGIPRKDYKLGLTRVFFRSGMLAELEKVLNTSSMSKKEKENIANRFRKYYARSRWLNAFAKVKAVLRFTSIFRHFRSQNEAALTVQRFVRGSAARTQYLLYKNRVEILQRHARVRAAKRKVRAMREEQERLRRKKAKEEAERLRKIREEKERQIKEQQRLAAEAAAAEEKAKNEEEKKRLKKKQKEQKKKLEEEQRLLKLAQEEEKKNKEEQERKDKEAEEKQKREAEEAEKAQKEMEEAMEKVTKKDAEEKEKLAKIKKKREEEEEKKKLKPKRPGLSKATENTRTLKNSRASGNKMSQIIERNLFLQPSYGTFEKRSRGRGGRRRMSFFKSGKPNWKTRFFVLNKESKTLSYYTQASDVQGRRGSTKPPKGMISLKGSAAVLEESVDDREFVLRVTAGSNGTMQPDLFISFPDSAKLQEWKMLIEECIKGFGTDSIDEEGELSYDEQLEKRMDKYWMKLQEFWSQGSITLEEVNDMIAEAYQTGVIPGEEEEKKENKKQKLKLDVKVAVCAACATLNDLNDGEKCSNCSEILTVATDDEKEEEDPIRQFKYNGGLLRIWHAEPKEFTDSLGKKSTNYGVQVKWFKDGIETFWSVSLPFGRYLDYQKLITIPDIPKLSENTKQKTRRFEWRKKQTDTRNQSIRAWWEAVLGNGDMVLDDRVLVAMLDLELETKNISDSFQRFDNNSDLTPDDVTTYQDIADMLLEKVRGNDTLINPRYIAMQQVLAQAFDSLKDFPLLQELILSINESFATAQELHLQNTSNDGLPPLPEPEEE